MFLAHNWFCVTVKAASEIGALEQGASESRGPCASPNCREWCSRSCLVNEPIGCLGEDVGADRAQGEGRPGSQYMRHAWSTSRRICDNRPLGRRSA
jgi:hypothetical protein